MSAPSRDAVRSFLLGYAWLGAQEERVREVDCIMSQDGWRHVDLVADRFAGAQEETGPAAFAAGEEFALTALYECHDGPHLVTCPRNHEEA